jgi:crossover junction endodeoxyribonuclease RuvC
MRRPIRILGIDPGLRRTGWGVVTIECNRLSFVACGSLASDERADLAVRLLSIHDGLQRVVAEHVPDEAAVEATFVNKDATATLKRPRHRGVPCASSPERGAEGGGPLIASGCPGRALISAVAVAVGDR